MLITAEKRVKEMISKGRRGPFIAQEMRKEGFGYDETVLALLKAKFLVWTESHEYHINLHVSSKPYNDQVDLIANCSQGIPSFFVWTI